MVSNTKGSPDALSSTADEMGANGFNHSSVRVATNSSYEDEMFNNNEYAEEEEEDDMSNHKNTPDSVFVSKGVTNKNNMTASSFDEVTDGTQKSSWLLSKRSCAQLTLAGLKYVASMALLVVSIAIVIAVIFTKQTKLANDAGPWVTFGVICFLIFWLAVMEGGQGCLVGLQPIDKKLYADSHLAATRCTELAHKGDNMRRFIVGRQFLVVLVVFMINLCGSAIGDAPSVLGFSPFFSEIFVTSGLALIMMTITLGQLTPQINASVAMLDFINNYFMLFTTYVSLAIEFSGLLHAVYLVEYIFSKIAGTPIESKEPPRSGLSSLLFWGRVLVSVMILGFAFAVTLSALFEGSTTMYAGVPEWISVLILFILMAFVGFLEGMQIALFAVVNLPEDDLKHHKLASKTCELVFRDSNLQAFLIGRQICTTICMFIVAKITSINVAIGGDGENNIFGASNAMQSFFNTGLLGALLTTIVGSLAWRIIAASFPVAFLSNPLIFVIVKLCLLLEASGICSASWILAWIHKKAVLFYRDEVYIGTPEQRALVRDENDDDIEETATFQVADMMGHQLEQKKESHKWMKTKRSCAQLTFAGLKYVASVGLLGVSIAIVMAAIFTKQTKLASDAGPWLTFYVIWSLVIWLAVMEGGQGSLVGLQPIDKKLYADSHLAATRCTTLAHKGDNMRRFIVGRQFLVVLVVFMINLCGSAIGDAPSVLGLSPLFSEIFLTSGLALIMMTITLGQLTPQINASVAMLDFINNYFMLFTTYVSLAIEFSGLLHAVYLVEFIFSKIAGTPIESKEPPRSGLSSLLFWGRAFVSVTILGFAFAVTLSALFAGSTTMYSGVPEWISVLILFILMAFVGCLEGMQIALFAVVNLPEDDLKHHKLAAKTCELVFRDSNLQAFLIGRQICTTICMFIVAKITSINVAIGMEGENNIFGVSNAMQSFFNTGLLGALLTTIVGSLAWRIIAASFPVAFLSNPLIFLIVQLCLLLEASGICSASWILAWIHKKVVPYYRDEVYIGTPEQRAAVSNKNDEFTNDLEHNFD